MIELEGLSLVGIAAVQVAASFTIGWIVADAFMRWAGSHLARVSATGLPEGIGLPERALLATAGFAAFATALMVAHIVTGGAVFGVPGVVPAAGLLVLVFGLRRHRLPRGVPWLRVALFSAVLVAIFVSPVLLEGSGVRAGDSTYHMGWTEQLLAGEPTPPGPAPEVGRNAYPWGFHAVMATMVRLVPGTDPLVAQEGFHLMILMGIPLAAACLARRVRSGAGWAGAAAALIGGWGWIAAGTWAFDPSPSEARFGADLVVASPNSVYELFSPALPRELGLVLLGAAGTLIVLAVRTEDGRLGIAAGISMGLVGLVSTPLFTTGALWVLFGALLAGRGARLRTLVAIGAPAAGVLALWAGPVIAGYVRYSGFVNISPQLGREWDFPTALWAWGLLLPLALVGLFVCYRSGTTGARVMLAFAAGSVLMLVVTWLRGVFEWNVADNATVLHQGRVWPVVHMLGAAFGGTALAALYSLLQRRATALAAAATALVVGVGLLSPITAAGGLRKVMRAHEASFQYGGPDFTDGSFVLDAAPLLEPDDVVRAPEGPGDNSLGMWLFQFSGARVTGHVDERHEDNELRIRYRDLAHRYQEVMSSGGFEADYMPVPAEDADGIDPVDIVARGRYHKRDWVLVDVSS